MWCMEERELREAEAALELAKRLGFVEKAGFEAVEERRLKKNEDVRRRLEEGQTVYGLTSYTAPAYLQYELTRFRMDFVSMRAADYRYREITEEEKKRFFRENPDLFTRYLGDSFSYEEVADVIGKRIREEEYHGLIKDILRECQNRE